MSLIKYCLIVLAGICTIATGVFAGGDLVPQAPAEIAVIYQDVNLPDAWNVILKWSAKDLDGVRKATGFKVYRSTTQSDNIANYTMIADVTTPLQFPLYKYTDERLPKGIYYYIIIGYNSNGDGVRSSIKSITIPQSNSGGDKTFVFATNPNLTVKPGEQYKYEAKAKHSVSSNNDHIRYAIVDGPAGATINELTGLITWTAPTTTGAYTFKIKAYLDNDASQVIYQTWTVKVSSDNSGGGNDKEGCVVVSGTIKDENGNAVTTGYITAYAIKTDNGSNTYKGMFKVAFKNGEFSMRISAGTYVFRVDGEDITGEWYENANEAAQARTFTVACNDTVRNVNFVVTTLPAATYYRICGQVKDATTNTGTFAVVYFYRYTTNTNVKTGEPVVVKTNASGEYCIELSNRYNYIAMASKGDNTDYLPQYFDGVSTPTQATLLTLTANRNDINFSLSMRKQYNNGFSGQMVDSAGTGVAGKVVAYLVVTKGNETVKERYRTVETDANGNYTFSSLEPGSYIVLGIPNNKPFVPGYFKENDYAALEWKNATQITIPENGMYGSQVVIKLRVGEGKKGIIKLGGGTKELGGTPNKGGNHVQATSPIPGVLVVVLDNNNKVVDYTFSQTNGTYTINEIGFGSNTVIADHPEFVGTKSVLTFTPNQIVVSNDVVLQRNGTTAVPEEAVSNTVLTPNPVNNNVHISFTANTATANISVVNILGIEVYTSTIQTADGVNNVDISTANFAAGKYFVRINIGSAFTVIPFTVSR